MRLRKHNKVTRLLDVTTIARRREDLAVITPLLFRIRRSVKHPLHQSIVKTTVSRFFTDKSSGAASPDPESEELSTTAIPKKPTFLQRFHIGSTSTSKKPKPPTLTIRPTTSSSLPAQQARSTSQTRAGSSHSNATTIAEITQIMPQSLNLSSTPPQTSNKRQRSRDSRREASRPSSAGRNGTANEQDRLARSGVRLPAYLSKSRSGMMHLLICVVALSRGGSPTFKLIGWQKSNHPFTT